jgi:hypothetical protein
MSEATTGSLPRKVSFKHDMGRATLVSTNSLKNIHSPNEKQNADEDSAPMMDSGHSGDIFHEKNLQKLEKLVLRLRLPDSGVTIVNRQFKHIKYHQSIVAKEIVDWLFNNCDTFDRSEAVHLAKEIVREGFAILVDNETDFRDSEDCFLYWQVSLCPRMEKKIVNGRYSMSVQLL